MKKIIIILIIILFLIQDERGEIIIDYNDLLILVNKTNSLPSAYTPIDLEEVSNIYSNKSKFLRKMAKLSFEKMAMDASKEGFKITLVSAYRPYDYQERLFNNYIKENGLQYAMKCSAKAGYSEHQTGLAIDIEGENNDYNLFADTKEFAWMQKNAYKYGFILRYPLYKENVTGYKYEPWHYRYVGIKTASFIYANNLTLEEYLKDYKT